METGPSSTDSSTLPPQPSETPGQEAVREGLSFRAGVSRLLGLFGAESIGRNLQAEDEAFARFCNGDRRPAEASGGADDMKITAAGNVSVNHYGPQQPAKSSSLLSKLALAASLASGSGALGYVINDLLKPTPAIEDSDTDTITEMDFPAEG